MKRNLLILILIFCVLLLGACSGNPAPQNANTPNKSANSGTNGSGPIAVHGGPPNPGGPGANSGPGPGGDPIDAKELDAAIEKAEKAHTAKPSDARAAKALADAYFARASALTEARQYRAALGDYRKTLKLDPTNEEARSMSGNIVSIMQQMGRDVPAEGQEPPAMRK